MLCTLLPVLYLSVTCHTPKWPPNVNRRRAPGVIRLGFNGYDTTTLTYSYSYNVYILWYDHIDDNQCGKCVGIKIKYKNNNTVSYYVVTMFLLKYYMHVVIPSANLQGHLHMWNALTKMTSTYLASATRFSGNPCCLLYHFFLIVVSLAVSISIQPILSTFSKGSTWKISNFLRTRPSSKAW